MRRASGCAPWAPRSSDRAAPTGPRRACSPIGCNGCVATSATTRATNATSSIAIEVMRIRPRRATRRACRPADRRPLANLHLRARPRWAARSTSSTRTSRPPDAIRSTTSERCRSRHRPSTAAPLTTKFDTDGSRSVDTAVLGRRREGHRRLPGAGAGARLVVSDLRRSAHESRREPPMNTTLGLTAVGLHQGTPRSRQRLLRLSPTRRKLGLEQCGADRRRRRVAAGGHPLRSPPDPGDADRNASRGAEGDGPLRHPGQYALERRPLQRE